MARQRTVKPEFWRDKKVAALGSQVALFYEALWCWADDGGVCRIEPDLLKGEVFARWHEYTHGVITECLVRLHSVGRIKPYEVGDELYAEIPTLRRHSPVNRPSKFRYPRDGKAVSDISAWVSGQYTHAVLSEHSSPVLPLPIPTPTPELLPPTVRGDLDAPELRELRSGIPEAYHDALTGILRAAQRPADVAATIRGMGPGGIQQQFTWATIGKALLDLRGSPDPRFEPRRFRIFCRKIEADDQPSSSSPQRRDKNNPFPMAEDPAA